MSVASLAAKAMEQGKGIVRLAPNWVPRSFCVPGRRIKLHPDDYYALGGERGGIDERWFSSTTPADNGPLTSPNEGLSFIVFEDGGKPEQFLLRDAIAELKEVSPEKLNELFDGYQMFYEAKMLKTMYRDKYSKVQAIVEPESKDLVFEVGNIDAVLLKHLLEAETVADMNVVMS